jgi:hypothetical protein
MKLVFTSLLVVLATSAVSAAGPESTSQPSAIAAPSAERIELARRFVELTNPPERLMEDVKEGFMLGASSYLADTEDENEARAAEVQLDRLIVRLEPTMRESMPSLLEAYAQVYAREFSAQELREMISFAETPAGKHYLWRVDFVDADPEILDAADDMHAKIKPVMDEFRKENCAKLAAERLAAGDTKAKCSLSAEDDTRAS